MSIHRLLLVVFFGLAVFPELHAAALHWEETSVERVTAPADREVHAEYRFRNVTNRTITIHSVATSCSCTTVALGKHTYAPGETGEIDVTFHVGSQTGRIEKFIYVRTATSPQGDHVELSLQVTANSYLSFTTSAAIWSVDNPARAKRIACRAPTSTYATLIGLGADNPAIGVRLDTIQAGKIYYVYATPTSTAQSLDTTLLLTFEMSDGHRREFEVPAIVLAPIHPAVAR